MATVPLAASATAASSPDTFPATVLWEAEAESVLLREVTEAAATTAVVLISPETAPRRREAEVAETKEVASSVASPVTSRALAPSSLRMSAEEEEVEAAATTAEADTSPESVPKLEVTQLEVMEGAEEVPTGVASEDTAEAEDREVTEQEAEQEAESATSAKEGTLLASAHSETPLEEVELDATTAVDPDTWPENARREPSTGTEEARTICTDFLPLPLPLLLAILLTRATKRIITTAVEPLLALLLKEALTSKSTNQHQHSHQHHCS